MSRSLEPTQSIGARGDVAVWDVGEGEPVLLMHGFPDHAIGLLDAAERFAAKGYRAIVVSYPGYWPSSPAPDGDYSMAAVAGDIVQVLGCFRAAIGARLRSRLGSALRLLAREPASRTHRPAGRACGAPSDRLPRPPAHPRRAADRRLCAAARVLADRPGARGRQDVADLARPDVVARALAGRLARGPRPPHQVGRSGGGVRPLPRGHG